MLALADQKLIAELKTSLQKVAGNRLQALMVYGSRVSGRASPDSDLDVAVTVRGLSPDLENALYEAAYQVMWDHNFTPLISLKVFDAAHFSAYQEQGFSFYRKVVQEGLTV